MTTAGDGATVLRPGEARAVDVAGFEVVVHADSATTGGQFSLIETVESLVGGGPPLHIHRDSAESFLVLSGRYAMHVDGREFDCPAGSFIYVPKAWSIPSGRSKPAAGS
jgi:mannose-6-phosphate isomerase-like protein (cupin superfamily)